MDRAGHRKRHRLHHTRGGMKDKRGFLRQSDRIHKTKPNLAAKCRPARGFRGARGMSRGGFGRLQGRFRPGKAKMRPAQFNRGHRSAPVPERATTCLAEASFRRYSIFKEQRPSTTYPFTVLPVCADRGRGMQASIVEPTTKKQTQIRRSLAVAVRVARPPG